MTAKKTVLLLYPESVNPISGHVLKGALHDQGVQVEELIMVDNYSQILDSLEEAVIPVVMSI
ncbi:MAG: hypothetical protein PF495_20000 [Spirochaetales bacterium]|jgi:multisubunit Na+/H+ antiporter MnhG subunit|nr:hypothetical protein [Spirochaetales bacterium]